MGRIVGLTAAAMLACAGPAVAGEAEPPGSAASGAEPPGAEAKLDDGLAERAAADGVARVIVEVQPSDPDALAAAGPETRGLCANEDCAKLRLEAALAPEEAPVVEDLGGSQMVMEVTPAGLEALAASPFVRRVMADALTPVPVDPERGAEPDGAPGQERDPDRAPGPPPGLDEPF